jgi:predicted TIM-barrel fold metal-dependent hydrolase
MKIFDCHSHITNGFSNYHLDVVAKMVIFNSFEDYDLNVSKVATQDAIAIILDFRHNFQRMKELVVTKKVNAIKIHSRILKIEESELDLILEHISELNTKLPIIYDAFYFGPELNNQPSLRHLTTIAKEFPENPIVVAHCGGHKVLEYFYHLRPLPNIYYDLSFSLGYLKTTSAYLDLQNLIRFTDKKKILFGSDFPFSDPVIQFQNFKQIATDLSLNDQEMGYILLDNANLIYKKQNG